MSKQVNLREEIAKTPKELMEAYVMGLRAEHFEGDDLELPLVKLPDMFHLVR